MSKITNEFRQSALRRGLLVAPSKGTSSKAFAYAGSLELANLGFIVAPSELEKVSNAAVNDAIKQARTIVGADRDMTPIYPGFPQQVQALSTTTLLVEQILHYWTGGAFLPDYPTIAREGLPIEDMLRNARELKVVSAAAAARELSLELVSNPVALSVDDKALMEAALTHQHPSVEDVVSAVRSARNGENIQSYISAVAKTGSLSETELALAVIPAVSNSDVLLRVMLALFTAPVGAPKKKLSHAFLVDIEVSKREANYKLAVENLADRHSRAVTMLNIPRPVRRAVVEKLGRITAGYKADLLMARNMLWRKVMIAVHPYDFKLTAEQKRAVDIIHANIDYKTLNSHIEAAKADRDVRTAVELMAEYQPANLLRSVVSLLRLVSKEKDAKFLAKAVKKVGSKANLTTLVSAYNGVISANDDAARVTRVAGLNNTMVNRGDVVKVEEDYVVLLSKALKKAIREHLATKDAPKAPVAVQSSQAVPLVRRDAATADRAMDRGAEFAIAGEGDTLRIFSHWNNNQRDYGYMDIGLVILDDKFEKLAVLTWDTWANHRDLGTYSGDKNVAPGDSASEYFDLELKKVRSKFPNAIYAAMTIQSYSGWATSKVDIIAGAMLRSKPESGEVFDPRSIATAFKPTTDSTQSVPLAVNLRSGQLVWVDSSNGSTASHMSSSGDTTVGSIVYDELERPRLTLGELAKLWAKAHGVVTVDAPVDRDALMKLL